MEAKAADLLAAFKNPNVSIDARVTHLTSIKSDIKQKNVPEGAIQTIFDTLKLAISSQHYSVCAAGFSTLGHFLKRLTIQDQQQWILAQTRNFYPVLMEKLGDHKERVRALSASIFTDLWPLVGNEVEYFVLEVGMVGKNPRTKESSLLWLSNMTKNHGLLFRQYVPSLVGCLEDADSAVRDTARGVVVDLFRTAPARAKSDLQKQLVARGVRKSIANAILSGIGLAGAEPEPSSSARPVSRVDRPISVMSSRSRAPVDIHDDEPEGPVSRPGSSRSHHERPLASSAVDGPARPKTPAELPPTGTSTPEDDGLEPFLVSSSRDIDDLARDMLPWFDGKESEDNWMKREKNVILFRRLTRGNAPNDFSQAYVHAAKTLLDGFFKVVNSLRTTLCTNGCLLIQDMARICGPKIDSMVEIMMQNLIKLCSALKKISAQSGNLTVDAVIGNVTFNIRLLQHVHWASQDKNVQVRLFAAGWLRTLINRQSHHKSTVEHGGGLDLIEKSIKKGLGDANPGVREATRGTFWTFFTVWQDRAESISSSLDTKSRNLLERDPANPNGGQKPTSPSKAPRSALKEAIAARKKAQMPSRPDSAQSFSDARSSEPAPKPATRTVPTGAPLSSLSSAPVRPSARPRRAEISRPATADPYARRPDSRAAAPSKQVGSPRSVRSKASTPSSKPINAPRLRPHEPPQGGTTRGKPKRLDLSKSKSHNDLRARSGSNDAMPNQPLQGNGAGSSQAFEEDAPAPIVLESPPLSASQPSQAIHMQEEPPRVATPEPVPEPEPMALEEPSPGAVSPERGSVPSTPQRHVNSPPAPDSSTKNQPDEMVIYEDPATPVSVHAETSQIEPVENLTPTQSPSHRQRESPEHATGVSLEEATTPVKGPAPDMAPRRDLQTDGANEPRFPSPVRRTPLRGSPSPSRNRTLGTPAEHGARETSLPEPVDEDIQKSPNNENATPHTAKSVDYTTTPRSISKAGALEEVPLNESALRPAETRPTAHLVAEEPRRARRWAERHRSPSPRSKEPANAKEMLHKALSRIASKSIDISGYRKLQGLFQYHGLEIVSRDEDYYAVLEALLNELEAAPTSRKDHDVKTQILATVRSMLLRTSDLFHYFDIPAMAALIRARRHYESSSHFVACLEEVAELLSSLIPISTSINGVLQGMEFEEDLGTEESSRSIIMGFSTINHVLSQDSAEISDEVLASVGSALSQHLGHPRPGVRKQATELCTLLNLKFGLDRVQKVTPSAGEGSLNLLTYFMARRSQ